MINRDNYLMVKKYLDYKRIVQQRDEKTVARAWSTLKHVLRWLDSLALENALDKRPTLPEYLLTVRQDKKAGRLHSDSMKKTLMYARELFEFARRKNSKQYKAITDFWLDTLQVRRSVSDAPKRLNIHSYWTLADIRKVITFPSNDLRRERDKAALAFLFLSGMRGGAFVTLPVEAVDVSNKRVRQLPELGVKTKNNKAAVTVLLPIADLLEIVKAWDIKVRQSGSSKRAWYARLDNTGDSFSKQNDDVGTYKATGRRAALYQGIKELCQEAGVEFKSPHKLRHGHGVFGVQHAKDMRELKAVSQNLMHANIAITDGVYGCLQEDEIASVLDTFRD